MLSNKKVKRSISEDTNLKILTNSNLNMIIIIKGISWGFVDFLVIVVDIRPYKYIEKRFNIIVVKMQTVIVIMNINSHER